MEGLVGTILSFNPQKRFGFIGSEQATAEFGKDVFCSSDEIGDFGIGEEVTFTTILNKNGQPQARLLQGIDGRVAAPTIAGEQVMKRPRLEQGSGAFSSPPIPVAVPKLAARSFGAIAPPPPAVSAYDIAGVAPPPPAASFPTPPTNRPLPAQLARVNAYVDQTAVLQGQRYEGTIMHFNPDKNFGFISSPAATEAFGKDVFLSSMEIQEFGVGDSVSFDLVLNKNGQPQARNLAAA